MINYLIIPGSMSDDHNLVDEPLWASEPWLSYGEHFRRAKTPEAVQVTAEKLEKELRGAA